MAIVRAAPTITTNLASGVTDLQATMKATVNANGVGVWLCEFQYGKTTSYEMERFFPTRYWVDGPTDGFTPISISGRPPSLDYANFKVWPLEPATTYNYRIYVRNPDHSLKYYGANQTFTTLSAKTKPVISANASGSSIALGYDAVRVNSSIFSGSSPATVSVEYGLTTSYGSQTSMEGTVNLNTTQATSINIPSLTPSTLYYFRWRATNTQGTSTGLAGSFTTRSMPTVTTSAATAITSDKATLRGTVNANDSQGVSPYFEYGITASYGTISYNASPGHITGSNALEVSEEIRGLLPNTTYHYRIFGNQVDMPTKTDGEDMTFTTDAVEGAPVINGPFLTSEITIRSAIVMASSVTAGAATATVSFEYGLTATYGLETTLPFLVAANTTDEKLTATLEGLLPNTVYHYRCKATSENGTTYGIDSVVTTVSVAVVTTGSATNIDDVGARLGGTVVPGGGPCYPGFQWGKTTAYGRGTTFGVNLTGSAPVQVESGAGPLEPSTTYHFRILVYDGVDTIYGNDGTFTTQPAFTPPRINITRVNYASFDIYDHERPDVSADSARLLASFYSGAKPARLAFEYGITNLYGSEVINEQTFPAQSVADYQSCVLRGLAPDTTYHFRSRVASDLGTVYSEDQTFTTLSLPLVLTREAALVTATDAVLRGSIDPKLWHYYPEFEFGTTPAFGLTPNVSLPLSLNGYQFGSPVYGSRNISASAGQLLPETTYFYRLTAKTLISGEWQYYYGPVQSFTTLANGAPAFGYAVRTTKNNSVSLGDGNLLTNITNSADLALTVSGAVSFSSQGGIVARGASVVIYTPAANFVGLDTFAMTIADGLGSHHNGIITAIVGDASSTGDVSTQFALQGGTATLVFHGIAGTSYAIQRSIDLKTWKTLQTVTATDNGMIPVIDPSPPLGSAYYRAISN